MFTRIVSLSLTVAAFAFAAAPAADKEKPPSDNTLAGSLVSVLDGKVTVLGAEGKKQTTFKMGKGIEVICDGKRCELKDLKKDTPVLVTFKQDGDNVLWAEKIEVTNEKKR